MGTFVFFGLRFLLWSVYAVEVVGYRGHLSSCFLEDDGMVDAFPSFVVYVTPFAVEDPACFFNKNCSVYGCGFVC